MIRDGGSAGVRSEALLASALARPKQIRAYGDSPDVIDMAAAYTVGLVRNPPFVDGNKRTGFVVGVLFLEMNGDRFTGSEEDTTQMILGLAPGTFNEPAFTSWLRSKVRIDRM